MGPETWRADENREDTDIVLPRREMSVKLIRNFCAKKEVLGCDTHGANDDGCKELQRKAFGQDELENHLYVEKTSSNFSLSLGRNRGSKFREQSREQVQRMAGDVSLS